MIELEGLSCRVCGIGIEKRYLRHIKCKPCYQERYGRPQAERKRERVLTALETGELLRCPRCDEWKSALEFYQSGGASYCKPCQREYTRERTEKFEIPGGPWVYLILCEEMDTLKIGFSQKFPHQRLEQSQIGNPYPLTFYGVIEGERPVEKFLHRTFAHFRLRGEWFSHARQILHSLELTMALMRSEYDFEIKRLEKNQAERIHLAPLV